MGMCWFQEAETEKKDDFLILAPSRLKICNSSHFKITLRLFWWNFSKNLGKSRRFGPAPFRNQEVDNNLLYIDTNRRARINGNLSAFLFFFLFLLRYYPQNFLTRLMRENWYLRGLKIVQVDEKFFSMRIYLLRSFFLFCGQIFTKNIIFREMEENWSLRGS